MGTNHLNHQQFNSSQFKSSPTIMSRGMKIKNRNRANDKTDGGGDNRSSGRDSEGDDGKVQRSSKEGGSASPTTSTPTTSPTTTTKKMTPSNGRFFTSHDKNVQNYIRQYYSKFVHLSRQQLSPPDFHERAKAAFERLRDMNYYQYDVVTAGGKHSSRTFVKRCLVGTSGITYKYLGLRLFAHSWDRNKNGTIPALQEIGDLNKMMIDMTRNQAAAAASATAASSNTDDIIGKYEYNLTLINYMEPTSHTSVGFKDEADFGMGKVSVSWHADSSLEPNSSIGVYHCLPTQRASRWDWRIALRPAPDSSSTKQHGKNNSNDQQVVPVVADTHDGDVYFLLGNMNETHQHAVLAGSQANRISSTHRVAVTGEDTYDYILKRVKIARKRFRTQLGDVDDNNEQNGIKSNGNGNTPKKIDAKVIRYCQQVLTEVEMEWIAQYWLQGQQHDTMHVWWQKPMKTLEAYWGALEEMTCRLYKHAVDNNEEQSSKMSIDVLKVLQSEFKNRQTMRQKWDERRADKIYQRRISPEYRPVARPDFTSHGSKSTTQDRLRLPKDLTEAIKELSKQIVVKKKFENNKQKSKTDSVDSHNKKSAQAVNTTSLSMSSNTKRSSADISPTNDNNPAASSSRKKKKKKKRHNNKNTIATT
mmetsp:Transcript_28465/g.69262  ORF Transcript_28465/g.69262 Transcript_28465/m.69262 type:complete len:644 (-) Transcript_28465:1574-3505(-)